MKHPSLCLYTTKFIVVVYFDVMCNFYKLDTLFINLFFLLCVFAAHAAMGSGVRAATQVANSIHDIKR